MMNDGLAKIVTDFRKATSAAQLAIVLNAVVDVELDEHPNLKGAAITEALLHHFAAEDLQGRYRTFKIPKKTSDKLREIKAPIRGLRRLQHLLLRCLTAAYSNCDDAAHGFVPGRSVLTNARPHVAHRFVLNVDLQNFFSSIKSERIQQVLQASPFYLANPLADLVTKLCCDSRSLPQGAPTSPMLSNAVCQGLDQSLRQLAGRYNCNYTRYADDITFSSNSPAFNKDFYHQLANVVQSEGFRLNPQKHRLQMPHQRQVVTGVVVNVKPNADRQYVREIRYLLYIWEKFGYEAANTKLAKIFIENKKYSINSKKVPKLDSVLTGRIAFLSMVNPTRAQRLKILLVTLKSNPG